MNNSISLCIISYDKDYNLIYNLLSQFQKQTSAPKEIIFYCSGVDRIDDVPKFLTIDHSEVPLHTILNKERTNQAKARNISSYTATGDYVMFFDVDDIPHVSKIEIIQSIIKNNPDVDFILHNYNQILASLGQKITPSEPIITKELTLFPVTEIDPLSTNVICGHYNIHHAHITVKRNILNTLQFNENIEYYRKEDGKFCQDLVLNNYKGLYTPLTLVDYIL